jgi:hypothetical protein
MPLFQFSVLKKFAKAQNTETISKAFKKFTKHFHNPLIQDNIRAAKEEQYQEGFLRELFVDVFGYVLNPQPNFNLTTELKNEKDSKKVDGAILKDGYALGVIELKGTDTKDLEKVRQQAFDYKANQSKCVYVITSNFEKLRFYINNAVEFEEFDLFNIDEKRFELMYICLAAENILNNVPLSIKEASLAEEESITKKFYADYSLFKRELFRDLVKKNLKNDALRGHLIAEDVMKADKNIQMTLFKKSQKLIDRFLFIFFAEDRGLVPPNTTKQILSDYKKLQEMDANVPLYHRFKLYFNYLDTGRKGTDQTAEIFAYNGGLFQPDHTLDSLLIDDELLYKHTNILSNYDFESQVDVNILGHIFENSLNEIESVNAEIEGTDFDKQKTKRKKDGVFYTPKYITKYIVDNTVGKLCEEKKDELGITGEDFSPKRQKETKRLLLDKLETYREWLLQLTICDPACGSGAFLNQALDFLINEHEFVDELQAAVLGGAIVFQEIENTILENNIYGVDLNEESVEIAKLSLWLRTAQPRRKLNSLNDNIKCGNSLIESKAVAGDKAFKWENEFPDVFAKGGFDVVIGNPPYVQIKESIDYFSKHYNTFLSGDLYALFYEKSLSILLKNGLLGFITPSSYMTNIGFITLREELLNFKINQLIDLGANVFKDTSVDSAIIVVNKADFNENIILVGSNLDKLVAMEQSIFGELTNKILNIYLNPQGLKLCNKIELECCKLDDYLKFARGVEFGFSSEHVFSEKLNQDYFPILRGGNISKHKISFENRFIEFKKNDAKIYKDKSIYDVEKILIKRIGNSIIGCYDDKGYLNVCDVYNLQLKKQDNYSLKSISAILNSKFINSYYDTKFKSVKLLFPKIPIQNLKLLPIPRYTEGIDSTLNETAKKILISGENLKYNVDKFAHYLASNFREIELNSKFQSWHQLTFSDFIKELNKAIKKAKGTPLTKLQEMEWMEVFEVKKKEALELKAEIDRTDKEIDQMVYELYGLTVEEIAIVENSGN